MPVMKRLTVDGVNYDTVGEASVTQVQTSGTKIATVTIDGTATDLYAPEGGGSGPEPSSTTPAMDGTAAVGTATTYARADHVHPTDTSRQATLVSGTNIKTVNGNSLLGSGDITTPTYTLPTASTSTLGGVKVDGSTITITDGVISSSGGGGGGNSGMTFFVSSVSTNNTPYIDSGLTTTVMEYYEYDLDAAWGDIREATSIKLVQGYGTSDTRICYSSSVIYDRPEDAIEIYYFPPRSNTVTSASIS